jgi:uncharacterized protein YcfJ
VITRSKMILALAGLALAAQVVAVDAHAQSARRKCINKDSNTVGGAVVGGILGGVAGAILGNGKGKNVGIGAGIGAVGGGAIAAADGSDACREVRMDREDRAEDRQERDRDRLDPNSSYDPNAGYEPDYDRGDRRDRMDRGDRRGPRRGTVVVPRYRFDQDFLRYYTQTYSDEQRRQQVADLAYDLQRRGELIDGYELYQVLVRFDGGRAQRLSGNRAEALFTLAPNVAGLNYDEAAWVDGLFPNKRHSAYPEVARTIRRLSY